MTHAQSKLPWHLREARNEKPLTDWSPRWRPSPERYRLEDARAELDPGVPDGRGSTRGGARVGNLGAVSTREQVRRRSLVCAHVSHAFGEHHQEALKPIAALLGSAGAWRMWMAKGAVESVSRRWKLFWDRWGVARCP